MGIFDKLFGKKKEIAQKELKERNIEVVENENVGFLASLNAIEKVAVSNLSPNIYRARRIRSDPLE